MTANEPSRKEEAANHSDVEFPGHSSLSDTQLRHRVSNGSFVFDFFIS